MGAGWINAELAPKAVAAAAVAVALGLAALSRPPPVPAPLSAELSRQAYQTITSQEPAQRRESSKKFPGDPWSQDDDFHEREQREARKFAGSHEARLPDVLRALDDGMHERWSTRANPQPRVPPCRPR